MSYSRELALKVLSLKPKSHEESRKLLNEVLEKEGFKKDDPELIGLRIDVAKAAREILQERLRRAS